MKLPPTYRVTLEVEFDLGIDEVPPTLAEHIQERLNDWCDGRHQFSVELFREGLERIITASLETAIDGEFRKAHGNAMISTATGKPVKNLRRTKSATSIAGALTEKAMQKVRVRLRGKLACPEVRQAEPPTEI